MTFVRPLKTHCCRGHPYSGENLRILASGKRVCLSCKRQLQEENRANGTNGKWRQVARSQGKIFNGYTKGVVKNTNPDVLRHALELIKQTGRRSAGEEIIGRARLKAILWFQPKLRLHVFKLTESTHYGRGRRRIAIQAAPAILRNDGADAFEAIQNATAHIWIVDRGDVMSLMFIDASEGKLKLRDCTPERANGYLKIHCRRPRVFGDYSLDATIGQDGTTTWLDTKTDEDRLWA